MLDGSFMQKYLSFKKKMKEIGRIERPDGLGLDFANFFNNIDGIVHTMVHTAEE